jgi:hypothetical protein
VAVVSLGDTLSFGICADPGIVEHAQTIADGIEAETAELTAADPAPGAVVRQTELGTNP